MPANSEVHLPSYPTAFIGRDTEIVEIAQRLSDPDCRLLTLVGPGGIGKTRLAIAAAQTMDFPNGIYFVDLQPVNESDLIVTAIASTLGIMLSGSEPRREQLLTYLRTRSTLLLIDNFEHLLDGVDLLIDIAQTAPDIKLLVTSREALNVREEWVWRVEGLQFPPNHLEQPIESYSAVEMFAECTHRAHAKFALDGQKHHVARICQLVEGMPLALELAAGWTKALSCAEIADEIQRGLNLLTTHLRNAPDRHRSIQAVFEHSWHLMTEDERTVFPNLSVFRGGFRREAAEQVAGASLTVLSGLVDKSFLRMDDEGRYTIHELIRQYGEQHLENTESLCDAHSAYYLRFLADLEADIKGRRQIEAVNEIDPDFENIRVAWLWAVDQNNREGIDSALECLAGFCDYRARLLDQEELFRRAQDRFAPQKGVKHSMIWSRITHRLAAARWHTGYGDEVENGALFEKALEVAEVYGDQLEIAHGMLARVMDSASNGQSETLAYAEKAVNIYQSLGNSFYLSHAYLVMAVSYEDRWQMAQAVKFTRKAVDLALQNGDKQAACWALGTIIGYLNEIGEYDEAEAHAQQLTKLLQEIGHSTILVVMLSSLCWVAFDKGDFEGAKALTEEGLKVATNANYPGVRVSTLLRLAFIDCMVYERYKEARQFCREALSQSDTPSFIRSWIEAVIHNVSGNYDLATQQFRIALEIGIVQRFHRPRLHLMSAAALLLAHDGEKERAAELLGLTFNHRATAVRSLEKWPLIIRLRADLQAEIGAEAYTAAWERGAGLDLETVEQSLLARWKAETELQPHSQPVDALTPRELEVLRLIVAGYSNRQIAHDLILSVGTVKFYVHCIFGKLGVTSRTQVVARARELNLF